MNVTCKKSAGLCAVLVRNLVTRHHRTRCEGYRLWASQSLPQSNSKASEIQSALEREYSVSLLRPLYIIQVSTKHQEYTTGGKNATVTSLTSK